MTPPWRPSDVHSTRSPEAETVSRMNRPPHDRTLVRVALFLALLLTAAAIADLWRGTGGMAWLHGVTPTASMP